MGEERSRADRRRLLEALAESWPIFSTGLALEIAVVSGREWDNTVPGKLSAMLEDSYPVARMSPRATADISIVNGVTSFITIPWTYLESADGTSKIGVGKERLHFTFERERLAQTSDLLFEEITSVWLKFRSLVRPTTVTRAGMLLETKMQVINVGQAMDLRELFGTHPATTLPVGARTGSYELSVDFGFTNPVSRLRTTQILMGKGVDGNSVVFSNDFDHVSFEESESPIDLGREDFMDWLNLSRIRISLAVEATVNSAGNLLPLL